MQIQRLQSLYLLIAAIFTGTFCFMPYAALSTAEGETVKLLVPETPVLFILNSTITVLLLITIFMYRNIRQQMKLAILDIALIVGSVVTTLIYVWIGDASPVSAFQGGAILLVLAESFAVVAYRRMKHDYKLLTSADRLR